MWFEAVASASKGDRRCRAWVIACFLSTSAKKFAA